MHCFVSQCFTKEFFYALLVVSTWSSKFVFLSSRLTSLPLLLLVLYAPTFFLLDIVVLIAGRLLLHKSSNYRRLSLVSAASGIVLAIITWVAASSQIAFYVETSGDIAWSSAGNFANDWDGVRLLLSGSSGVLLCAAAIATAAYLIKNLLYAGVAFFLHSAWSVLRGHDQTVTRYRALQTDLEQTLWSESSSIFEEYKDDISLDDGPLLDASVSYRSPCPLWLSRGLVLAPVIFLAVLQIVRPRTQPYPHLSGTLPFNLVQVFSPPPSDFCLPGLVKSMKPFPLPHLLATQHWTPRHGYIPSWQPSANWSAPGLNMTFLAHRPHWLPGNISVPGFERWTLTDGLSDTKSYHPELDPLKLSNLDEDILGPIKDSLRASQAKIKHIVLLTLESTRADVFPLTNHSHLYDAIVRSHSAPEGLDTSALDSLLANISPNAELLTGTVGPSAFSKFRSATDSHKPGSWRERLSRRPSSLNIIGATTGSSMSSKSVLGTHCGVHPLPVEFTEESALKSYQPCLPHILDLFNENKPEKKHKETIQSALWVPIYAASVTDQYDRQDKMNAMMGFHRHNIIVKSNLTDPQSNHWPPTQPESFYFGYPETQLKPYLRDVFRGVQDKGQRLFLSHFTSQTHHPFTTPDWFGQDEAYMGKSGWGNDGSLNGYLNVIRYADGWLGEVMDMLDEANMTNETLVVLVGDHGWAFDEDGPKHSSFENPHIANFRVPLSFQHPALPPLQLSVNATNIQILPTILDLLLSTESLSDADAEIANNILPHYQGQSLLRPLKTEEHGRELWTPAIVMSGGGMLNIGSAASPYRLSLPLCRPVEYRFTDISRDPYEEHPTTAWSIEALTKKIEELDYDEVDRQRAVDWTRDAEKVARWWSWESKRLWRYGGAAEMIDRGSQAGEGTGTIRKEHWWDT